MGTCHYRVWGRCWIYRGGMAQTERGHRLRRTRTFRQMGLRWRARDGLWWIPAASECANRVAAGSPTCIFIGRQRNTCQHIWILLASFMYSYHLYLWSHHHLCDTFCHFVQMCRQGYVSLTTVTVPVYNLYFTVTHRFWMLGLLTVCIFHIPHFGKEMWEWQKYSE